MNSRICEMLDIEFPLVAFTHCRDVVVAVSKAGGCGVLGAVGMSPEQLEKELKWIDEHIDGKPYGVDVLIPNKMVGKDEKFDADKLAKMIPQEYADFILVIVGMLFLAFGVYLVYSFGGFWGILVGVVSGLIGLFFMYAPQHSKK